MAERRNLKEIERTLKALANQRRLSILVFLASKNEATVGRIAEEIRLSFKSTSRHLSVLAGAGILEKEQRSREIYLRISDELPKVAALVIGRL